MHRLTRAAPAATFPILLLSLMLFLIPAACSDGPTEPGVLGPVETASPAVLPLDGDWLTVKNLGPTDWSLGGEMDYSYDGGPVTMTMVRDAPVPVGETACIPIDELSDFSPGVTIWRFKPAVDGLYEAPYWDVDYPWVLLIGSPFRPVAAAMYGEVVASAELTWHDDAPVECGGGVNQPPVIELAAPYVVVPEGTEGVMTMMVTDPDGDVVVPASANVGMIEPGKVLGEWVWRMRVEDGPVLGEATVVFEDARGAQASVSFTYDFTNEAPTITAFTLPETPVPMGTAVAMATAFTDPAGTLDAPYQCLFNVDTYQDIILQGEPPQVGYGESCGLSYTYTEPGVYGLAALVEDKDAATGHVYGQVVVYDPTAGFVTGGGWYYSETGMFVADPTAQGKATFGFVAKYPKGKTTPEGSTEFQFEAGDLHFNSTAYDWLLVTKESEVRLKGSGLLNGELAPNGAPYRFMMLALDSPEGDGFRMSIWWEDEATGYEMNIYYGGGPLLGGAIVVHAK